MIAITKNEKDIIQAKFPRVHIARTMKQRSSRHHYYMEEMRGPMKLLRSLRGIDEKREEV